MPVADDGSAVDSILQKVLDAAVPFRLSLDDGVAATRRRLRELPRRPVHPELRVANRTIGGPAGDLAVRISTAGWRRYGQPCTAEEDPGHLR